jgi:hydrogenase maturation protease
MMTVKVFFIGNTLGGDDGIGPYLYNELKDNPKLNDFTLMEMGVIGIDLISYIEENDKVIIVDAVKSNRKPGEVFVLDEDAISKDISIYSLHDLGVEQTASLLRKLKPGLNPIKIIAIEVENLEPYSDKMSDILVTNMDSIKKEVINNILSCLAS